MTESGILLIRTVRPRFPLHDTVTRKLSAIAAVRARASKSTGVKVSSHTETPSKSNRPPSAIKSSG
jgi:hypothetical protein